MRRFDCHLLRARGKLASGFERFARARAAVVATICRRFSMLNDTAGGSKRLRVCCALFRCNQKAAFATFKCDKNS